MVVQWKINGIFKADAEKVYREIGSENVTPEEVVEKAKNKKSELHKCFEWDDKVAADQYRLEQAKKIIRFLVTVPDKEDEAPRRVLQISSVKATYQPDSFFIKNDDEYQILLKRAMAELKGFQQRYAQLSELEEVFEAINNIVV